MNFYQAVNQWANGSSTNYNKYVGRTFLYGNKEITIIGVKDDYFECSDGQYRKAKYFIEDYQKGVYKAK